MDSNKKRNIQQHFVTAAYLAGFTPDGGRESQLYIYERNTEKMFRAIPDEAAKRRNYYSLPLPNGGFDDSVDTMLTALEGQAMPGLQKIVAGDYNLSIFERGLLAFLIAFQEFPNALDTESLSANAGGPYHFYHAHGGQPTGILRANL